MTKTVFLLSVTLCALPNRHLLAQYISNECDTSKINSIIWDESFNRLPKYDAKTFTIQDFYKLDKDENRILWYRDIENIDTTKFTSSWNDYARSNYHASHLDFIKYYENRQDIELAFQLGPNGVLWTYYTFVVKKINGCYLVTRTNFAHARFRYKAYAIIDKAQLDTLYSILENTNRQLVTDKEAFSYCGYFVDNRNERKFYLDFQKDVIESDSKQKPKPEILELYDFVDKKIIWTKTYLL